MKKKLTNPGLEKAISMRPTLKAFSDELGVPYQVVQQWRINGVPTDRCPSIEKMTCGAVKCEDLDSKTDWAYIRASTPADMRPTKPKRRTTDKPPASQRRQPIKSPTSPKP